LLTGDHLTVAVIAMTLIAGLPAALVCSNTETSAACERSEMRQQS